MFPSVASQRFLSSVLPSRFRRKDARHRSSLMCRSSSCFCRQRSSVPRRARRPRAPFSLSSVGARHGTRAKEACRCAVASAQTQGRGILQGLGGLDERREEENKSPHSRRRRRSCLLVCLFAAFRSFTPARVRGSRRGRMERKLTGMQESEKEQVVQECSSEEPSERTRAIRKKNNKKD